MQRQRLGQSGIEVSSLALGTGAWGRDTDEYEAREQLDVFLEAGGNLIDTADMYGDGAAEKMIGEFLTEIPRHEYIISTKAGRQNADRSKNSSRTHLLRSLEESLQRLQTDYIDIWHIHAYDAETTFEEVASVLTSAVDTGKVRYLGVSNYSAWQLVHLNSLLPAHAKLVSAQYEYSLLQRGIESELLPAINHLGIGLLAWSPLGRGVLTGKYRNSIPADSRAASPHWGNFTRALMTDSSRQIVEAVAIAAQGLNATPLDVAMAWVRQTAGVSSAITGGRTAAQSRAILNSADMELPAEIMQALNDVSRPVFLYPGANLQ